jgi:lipooligosaccharide transport system permease protein
MRETLALSWHLVRRNWWVYRKDFFANISPTLCEPAFTIFSLGVGLGAFVSQVQGRSYVEYLAPGLVVSIAMFTSFFETSYGFYVQMTFESIFKAMLTTPITIGDIVVGEFVWVSIKAALMVIFTSMVLLAFGVVSYPPNLVLAPIVGILVALPLGAIGLLASCWVKNINQFQTVYSFILSQFRAARMWPEVQLPIQHYRGRDLAPRISNFHNNSRSLDDFLVKNVLSLDASRIPMKSRSSLLKRQC